MDIISQSSSCEIVNWITFLSGFIVTRYLFGSKADDEALGGDIDILIIDFRKLTFSENCAIKFEFMKRFGEKKIDLVSFTESDKSPFKDLALEQAVELWVKVHEVSIVCKVHKVCKEEELVSSV